MARQVLEAFLLKPTDLDVVWPAPKISPSGEAQSYGPDGIVDPMMKRELWAAAGDLFRADLQRADRSPRDIKKIREILGQSGYELATETPKTEVA